MPVTEPSAAAPAQIRLIRALTYLMFFMFAMTTDSVGVIIPQVVQEFGLSLTAAGALHYGSMTAIALAGLLLGFLADRYGRKPTILLGLGLFTGAALFFPAAGGFLTILALIMASGLAIGIFKTGALALVGDISRDVSEHTRTMNLVEGFFGVGAIVGPLLVTQLVHAGVSWRWLYVLAGVLSLVLIAIAASVRYPGATVLREQSVARAGTGQLLRSPYALGFSVAAFCYVAVECAIYVWMPTLVGSYQGSLALVAAYALPIFFTLRAAGRFLGAWLLDHLEWSATLALCSAAIFLCFAGSLIGGVEAALILLPGAGLFMSVMYPTINSKGIACYPRCDHGRVSGLILFFTCCGAAIGPFAMGAVSDAFGGVRYGFMLAAVLAAVLAGGFVLNWIFKPAHARLGGAQGGAAPTVAAH